MSEKRRYSRRLGDRILRIPRARPWRVALPVIPRPKTGRSSSIVLIYGFAGTIVIGTILLILPIASKAGQLTPLVDALFTATSAVCVTGLVVLDTADYWSGFGQAVILAMIQIGGFGFMTSATLFLLAFGRRIGLRERLIIGESMGLARLGGIVKIVKQMAIFTACIEITGAAIFYIRFSTENSVGVSVWRSVFQAVSAFNNAGFDIFGSFRSLASYQGDSLVLLVTAALIFLGGISFLVLSDLFRARGFTELSLDSRIVLLTTVSLLALGTIVMLLTEFRDPDTIGALPVPQKLLNAFFQSVTARTAGFSTVNMANVADYALFFTMLLMFVGGASGSTAGGIKVNTFGVIIATVWSAIRGKEHAGAFGREFSAQQIHRALAVAMLALALLSLVVFLLTVTEDFRFLDILFETVSAFGTVGLSTGITPGLSVAGRLIVTATMFVGRLGPLALVLSLIQHQHPANYRYPQGMVRIG
jgi:trk system potassium uptake protein TrkH